MADELPFALAKLCSALSQYADAAWEWEQARQRAEVPLDSSGDERLLADFGRAGDAWVAASSALGDALRSLTEIWMDQMTPEGEPGALVQPRGDAPGPCSLIVEANRSRDDRLEFDAIEAMAIAYGGFGAGDAAMLAHKIDAIGPQPIIEEVRFDYAYDAKSLLDKIGLPCKLTETRVRASTTRDGPFLRRPIPERVRNEVWRRDEGRCVDCGSRARLEFDHIIPLSAGGSDTPRNLELRCEVCNRRKAARV
jgi:hypothetical protein